jgi:hypothetical protein
MVFQEGDLSVSHQQLNWRVFGVVDLNDTLVMNAVQVVKPTSRTENSHIINRESTHMENDNSCNAREVSITDLATFLQEAAGQLLAVREKHPERSAPYRLALGQETIQLGIVEFRILLFLAGRPYHAFTRRAIADAVSSEQNPVEEDTVDRYVDSLLDQLGVFHDYVQSVPYVGYRFKA